MHKRQNKFKGSSRRSRGDMNKICIRFTLKKNLVFIIPPLFLPNIYNKVNKQKDTLTALNRLGTCVCMCACLYGYVRVFCPVKERGSVVTKKFGGGYISLLSLCVCATNALPASKVPLPCLAKRKRKRNTLGCVYEKRPIVRSLCEKGGLGRKERSKRKPCTVQVRKRQEG